VRGVSSFCRVREPVLQRGEQDVTEPIADVRAVNSLAAQRAPDLLHSPAIQDQHPARKVAAQGGHQFFSPPRQGVSHQLQQPGHEGPLQPDDCFRAIALPVILRREQPPLRVKISEPGVCVIVRVLLAAVHPDNCRGCRREAELSRPMCTASSSRARMCPRAGDLVGDLLHFACVEMADFACGLAGFQSSGRLCSLWNCSIRSDPSIGSPCSSVDLNSCTSPKPWMLTSARISPAWSSVA
jgi:hypothetical protein